MVEMSKIRKGDILITEETRFGFQRIICGPVTIIDTERGEIGIKTEDNTTRSFPSEQLSTVYAFVNNCRVRKSSPDHALMGYIVSLAEGQTNALQEIADYLKKQGVKPVASQDVLEALLSR